MSHKSQTILSQELDQAAKKVTVGELYFHYKHPEHLYLVKQLAILEATEEICILYESQYDNHIPFVRPLASWLETVEKDGRPVPRFKLAIPNPQQTNQSSSH